MVEATHELPRTLQRGWALRRGGGNKSTPKLRWRKRIRSYVGGEASIISGSSAWIYVWLNVSSKNHLVEYVHSFRNLIRAPENKQQQILRQAWVTKSPSVSQSPARAITQTHAIKSSSLSQKSPTCGFMVMFIKIQHFLCRLLDFINKYAQFWSGCVSAGVSSHHSDLWPERQPVRENCVGWQKRGVTEGGGGWVEWRRRGTWGLVIHNLLEYFKPFNIERRWEVASKRQRCSLSCGPSSAGGTSKEPQGSRNKVSTTAKIRTCLS